MADALFPQAEDTDGLYGQNLVTSEAYAAERSAPLAREVETMNTQETTFATRLKSLLTAKNLSQRELAERVGCSQPAISLMLQRACRPQKKTILKLASALQVAPRELWPDLDMAEMLDAVASFQSDDYVMSEAEAQAMAPTAKKNRPKIAIKPLPPRS
jgi:transcriptional regulator with XRE-family HTH domain